MGARVLGRYVLHGEFASGGMAAVHFGRLVAEAGFTRTVAIKRLHPQHAKDPEFVGMLLDEARLAGRIRHPNVAPILDVVQTDGEVFLVMEYVHGESLAVLSRATRLLGSPIPARLASSVVCGVLHGLAAAHVATSDSGEPLGIVHRDVSPENILVGTDGVARVLDFGVALASGRSQVTREGGLKGKLGYMAPELLHGDQATALSDVYSTGVVLWEALTGDRLFSGNHEGAVLARVLEGNVPPPGERAALPPGVDRVVLRALARSPADRYRSAEDFALALEAVIPPGPARDVAAWVQSVGGNDLAKRATMLAEVEGARPPKVVDVDPEKPAPPLATDVMRTLPLGAMVATQVIALGLVGDGGTQVLSATAVDASREARAIWHARRTGTAVAALCLALLCVATAWIAVGAGSGGRRAATADGEGSAAPGASASTAQAGETSAAPPTTAPLAPSVAAPTSDATEAPEASAAPTNSAGTPRGLRTPNGRRSGRAPPSRSGPCDPPYTIDERGIHRYKPGCL